MSPEVGSQSPDIEHGLWHALTKERGESMHRAINYYIFEKLLFFLPYKKIAQGLLPENPTIDTKLKDRPHSDRLKIYNRLYQVAQYFHYLLMGVGMFLGTVDFQRNDPKGITLGIINVVGNATLSLNISHNRRETKRRIKLALEKEAAIKEPKESLEETTKRKARNRRKRERKNLRKK